ncbi:interferon-induced GTP-binding protein Mx isoform X2 [Struthio camelus]|uniref:interferon-induced GTP-binding protein Mx isoform X2 n=1 Tax=Struthio camelus TaxID=8801 RepID=UPI00051E51B0|nr:PREDICTED: interferon-induced GTP-binding protein Mx-like isoform X2 [Struthio camelus australis]
MNKPHNKPRNQQVMDNKHFLEKRGIALPSTKPLIDASEVPLPPDLDDQEAPVNQNKMASQAEVRKSVLERKPQQQQEQLEKLYYRVRDKMEEHTLYSQYEQKIRPCIDLIDSLRALGVEKDLALPAIAVIGDQSSGKSSVLEALSGIALPRGNGIVTRCPLELKLKKTPATQKWKGKISYRNTSEELQNPSEVEKAIRAAQNIVAGTKGAISRELISLEVWSPTVPDLTLIDLPGIARVAVGDQPEDIGEQIKKLLKNIIGNKETLNLVVVPCNVDIATTEALKMAQEVDPKGERTLGILTKPDLVDKGTEESIVNIIQNLIVPLKKGYMVVKCRGQQDIRNNLTLASAIQQEKEFFETHEHFSILLHEGKATIPLLAEKLTSELVGHIIKTLPALENQIRSELQKTLQELHKYRRGIPTTESDKLIFLTDLIKLFNEDIAHSMYGEEHLSGNEIRLFTKIRREFQNWEGVLQDSSVKVTKIVPKEVWKYEVQYRGRELPGFTNYRTFEDIVKAQIMELEEPAITILNAVVELVEESFLEVTKKHFADFHNLYRAAKARIEDIKEKQAAEAERNIRIQFKMEKIVYCQDYSYIADLKTVKGRKKNSEAKAYPSEVTIGTVSMQDTSFIEEMVSHTQAYFNGARNRLSSQIPLIILFSVLQNFGDTLQTTMLHLLQEKEKLTLLLQEDSEVAKYRHSLSQRVNRLTKACQYLRNFASLQIS